MKFTQTYLKLVKKYLPSPMVIAIFLTVFTAVLALFFGQIPADKNPATFIANAWQKGFWELLEFTMQMVLMLILGHSIALSPVIEKFINRIVSYCKSNAHAAILVTLFSVLMGYFNWGLGLVFGAILARKVGEYAHEKHIKINYPLIAACGYTALMVWHGGLSGSAPLTVNKAGHSLENQMDIVPLTETIFSASNMVVFMLCVLVLPIFAWWLSKGKFSDIYPKTKYNNQFDATALQGAEKLDRSEFLAVVFGGIFLIVWFLQLFEAQFSINFLSLNNVNFLLFSLAILSHRSLAGFLHSIETAILGSTGIIIQFPLYAGIMGLMKYSGLLESVSQAFVHISSAKTFPFFAYLSSAIVNILVPSGGGQWQVQGPILIEAAQKLGVSNAKTVMALAYGDQLTNMLQPFWALPLLGITGLKARDILPYSVLFMLVGALIFLSALYLF
ncbi:MAG: short-chain fatty acid transporter [Flavobacteriales bacterium]|nr:short-chain fatty acid transporter [Flavobacteriales bacterium]